MIEAASSMQDAFSLTASSMSDRMQDLIHTPGVPPLAFLFAFLAGAGHAVAPGHGKTLAAAYLAGSRGRVRDAAWLGGSVAAMHTISVLVIGVAWTFFSLSHLVRMEQLTSWLQVVAGILVVVTGAWMLRRHVRGHTDTHDHNHGVAHHGGVVYEHGAGPGRVKAKDPADGGAAVGTLDHAEGHGGADGHSHADDHGHLHGRGHLHGHDHSKRPGLLLLGISGGLTPSPAAFLVLATGLFLGRGAFALLLVVTFGLGMAVVLFTVGVLAVAGSSLVTRNTRMFGALQMATRVTPVLAAAGVTIFGAGLVTLAAVHLSALS